MIRISPSIVLDPADVTETFVRSSGPGGQNVNKVASAVQLRFPIDRLAGMSASMRARLVALAGRRLTAEGEIVITADRFRTQADNRADAMARLVQLLKEASIRPKPRIATRPTLASKQRRVADKVHRAVVKRLRARAGPDD